MLLIEIMAGGFILRPLPDAANCRTCRPRARQNEIQQRQRICCRWRASLQPRRPGFVGSTVTRRKTAPSPSLRKPNARPGTQVPGRHPGGHLIRYYHAAAPKPLTAIMSNSGGGKVRRHWATSRKSLEFYANPSAALGRRRKAVASKRRVRTIGRSSSVDVADLQLPIHTRSIRGNVFDALNHGLGVHLDKLRLAGALRKIDHRNYHRCRPHDG